MKRSNTHISTFIIEFFSFIISNNTSVISFLDSKKGHQQLIRDGFIYKFNKQTSSKIYWICKTKDSKAYVHTDLNNNFLNTTGKYDHLVEPEEFEVERFRKFLKDRVVNETVPISKIYDEEIAKAQFPSETLASIPVICDIRKLIFLET
jgi:hypothetical protein